MSAPTLEALVEAIMDEVGEPRVVMIGWAWEVVSISREAHKGGILGWARDFAERIAALPHHGSAVTEELEAAIDAFQSAYLKLIRSDRNANKEPYRLSVQAAREGIRRAALTPEPLTMRAAVEGEGVDMEAVARVVDLIGSIRSALLVALRGPAPSGASEGEA